MSTPYYRRFRPRHRRLFALSIATVACVALVASSVSAGKSNAKPSFKLTIGGLVPDTGPFTFAGAYTHKNAQFAVSLVNKALKENGWRASVKLVTADTQTRRSVRRRRRGRSWHRERAASSGP